MSRFEREDVVTLVFEVAEGRQDATGVGVHGRPHAAAAGKPRPLPAQIRALLEDRRLESLRQQPTCRDEPARTSPDHGDVSRHRGTVAWLRPDWDLFDSDTSADPVEHSPGDGQLVNAVDLLLILKSQLLRRDCQP